MEEGTAEVPMKLGKVWDASAERWRVGIGGVWPVEAICILVDGEERWVLSLDGLPAELSEQAHMWQREQGADGEDDRMQEWMCSEWRRRPGLVQLRSSWVLWIGWGSHGSSRVLRRTLLRGWSSNCWGKGTAL